MQPRKILIAGLDVHSCHRVCRAFELDGFSTAVANAGGAIDALRADQFDLVVFSQSSCGHAMRAVLAPTRAEASRRPPFMVALVPPDQQDHALALMEEGIDAFLVEPIGCLELVARARSLLRRRHPAGAGLEVDVDRRRACLRGEPLTLTEQEFQLLHLLARHPGRVFDRGTLLSTLWGGHTFVAERTVDALVKRLRQRLDAPGSGGAYIQTVRGVGYRLAESHAVPRILSNGLMSLFPFTMIAPLVTLLSQT